MAVLAVLLILSLSAALIYAGAVEINRRAERWERYEKWMHPPNDDDGVSVLEGKDNADT
jgi:hypothetical protein